jgi:hypothetical protein
MRTVQRPYVFLFIFPAILALTGCSKSAGGRMEITGSVNLVGKPINGIIQFKPLENQDTQEGAQIIKGEYKIPGKQGLKPGKYLVIISSGDGKTPVNLKEDEAPGPSVANITSVDLVPEEWNTKSNKEITVKSEPPNKFDFDIPNYAPPPKIKGGKKK